MNIGKSDESAPDEESDRSFVESRLTENLRRLGRDAGYATDSRLAEALGVSQSTFSGWMGGSGFRKVAEIAAKLRIIGQNPWDLFADAGEALRPDERELVGSYRELGFRKQRLLRSLASVLAGTEAVELPDDREMRLVRAFRLKLERNPDMAEAMETVLLDEFDR